MMIIKNLKVVVLAVVLIISGIRATDDIRFVKIDDYAISAMNDNKDVGRISYSTPDCLICSLYVDKEFRKKGIGSQLFKRAINEMKRCENIGWSAQLNSIDFYFKQGAQINADRECWVTGKGRWVCYKNATEQERTNHLQHLYKLKKDDPTLTYPYLSMRFDNKQQK